ncbi:rhodanese-like domain-containing protein [Mariniflexile litorale]|uniref:Rhodanese-like domain-containing protein n=1 Tax=Mariniflexile litorale TaxID=3045158 RepID=A0AAU7EDS1_9FLAO|nr:rhodanese-like domain-containing protein [Mariniflexile sp. KMM 9835]MDQ8212897.1 rhodanese-like domain-containing protein [Mariniflexile sp. KMM 9835]
MTLFSFLFGTQVQNSNIKVLPPEAFKKQITSNSVQLIDVRTVNEFKSGHIKDAKNIDFFSSNFNTQLEELNKEKPIYLYCRSGNRSNKAANQLAKMGFTEIYDLKGGFLNWKN